MEIGDDFAPENAALHDVGFFNRMHFMPPLAGQFEPDRSDAANLVFVIGLRIKSAALPVRHGFDTARLAEINTTRQLADNEHVETFNYIFLQRRRIQEPFEGERRAKICEEFHFLAQFQETGFGPLVSRRVIVFWPADRAEQNRVGVHRGRQRIVGQRRAMCIVGGAADEILLYVKADSAVGAEPINDPHNLFHNFRTDAVARQNQ